MKHNSDTKMTRVGSSRAFCFPNKDEEHTPYNRVSSIWPKNKIDEIKTSTRSSSSCSNFNRANRLCAEKRNETSFHNRPIAQNNSVLNTIIGRNEELSKLRANIKGLAEKIDSQFNSKSSVQKYSQTPVAKEYSSILKSYPEKLNNFSFQPLHDKTNIPSEFKQQVIYPSDKIDSHWKNSMIKLPESVSKSSNRENSEKRSFEDTENDQDRSNIHIEEESEDIYDSVDTFDKDSYNHHRKNTETDAISNETDEISAQEFANFKQNRHRFAREIEVNGNYTKNQSNNPRIQDNTKSHEPAGMFDELENIVQNLGNNSKKKPIDSQEQDNETEENQADYVKSYQTTYSQNSNDYNSLLTKCEYLESLNQNLVSENAKLKMQLESECSKSKQYQIELRSNYDNMSKSQKNHLAQIKNDFQNLIEESKREHKRKEENIKKEFQHKESELREKLRLTDHILKNEAEPRIQHLEKEMSELISELNALTADIETLKSENDCLKQRIEEEAERSEDIIEVKDGQIKQLKECNQRLSATIEDYESKERLTIEELKEEHLKLQVEFERVCTELENKNEEEKERLQECYGELDKANQFNHEL